MNTDDAVEIIEVLEKSRAEFNDAVKGLEEASARAIPAEDRWSAVQCVEHVTMVEERFVARLEAAEPLDVPRVDKQREADLSSRLRNRTNRAVAPEAASPKGRFTSLAEAIDHFNAVRTRTIHVAKDRSADLYRLSVEHPRFGVMNGVEFMHVIAGHSCRHADQIREIRAGLG